MAVAVYCGIAIAVPKAEQKSSNSDRATQHTHPDQRGTPGFPFVVNARTIQSDNEAAEEAEKNAEQKRINRWNIGLTFAIAICAFLQFCGIVAQVVVYFKQTTIMRDTLAAISKQATTMDVQANDARASATASGAAALDTLFALKRQADLMESQNKAIRDRERARITLIFPPDEPDFKSGLVLEFENYRRMFVEMTVGVHNDGLSKAFNVRARGGMTIQPENEPFDERDLANVKVLEVIGQATLEDPVSIVFSQFLVEEDSHQIEGGTGFFFLYGEITYDDVFGDKHCTPFRFRWDVDSIEEGGQMNYLPGWTNESPMST
jgi:hypothetical protein